LPPPTKRGGTLSTKVGSFLIALVLLRAAAFAATPPCPGGRFLLPGAPPLIPGAGTPDLEVVVVEARTVAIASGCPAVTAKVKGTRRGTRVRATWPKGVCAGSPRKIKLNARIDSTCTNLGGKIRGKKLKRRFTARLSQCGDGIADREGHETCPLLEGPDDAPALEATLDVDAPTPIPEAAHDVDAHGVPLVRTRIELVFTAQATVAQVNALIAGVDGRIVSMLEGVPSIVLDLPDPGSVAALEALVAGLSSDPAVRFVLKASEPAPDVLPDNYTPSLADPEAARIDHQLAVRAAAAWNARAAMGQLPTVAVLDYFGDGAPNGDFDLVAPSPGDFTSAGQGDDGEHGYHVLGIITGRVGGPNTDRGQVTGMFPGTAVVRVADIRDPNTDSLTDDNRVLQRLRFGAPHGVLNTSLGASCGRLEGDLALEATWWAEKVRALGLENRVLHLTSAGNVKPQCPTEINAFTNSSYSAAALLPLPVANLTNVLVVENAVNGGRPTFATSCLEEGSKVPGDLAAIGTSVFSFTGASSGAGNKTGTSMATPQVAGLAAYLWALAPAMTVQQVRQALLATAAAPVSGGGVACSAIATAPVVDAYAAVLSLDAAALPNPIGAPIRQAILDVDGSGRFDDADVAAFVDALVDPNTGDPREPTDPDFGRHDLNGDGFTGGGQRTAAFDLDRIDSVQFGESGFGVVFQTIGAVDVPFDETKASDLDVLCYYAYSDLFEGPAAARDEQLPVERCVGAGTQVLFPGQVKAGTPAPLSVRVLALGHGGAVLGPLAGVRVELSPSGGTVAASEGTTDADGFFDTSATADEGVTTLTIGIVVRQAPGTPELTQDFAQASVDPGENVDCRPLENALSLRLSVTGVDTETQFGNVGGTLTDVLDIPDEGRVEAQVSMGSAHATAELDDATFPATGRGFTAIASFDDHLVVTPSDPALAGTLGTFKVRAEVTATGSASGDASGSWNLHVNTLFQQASRTGRFTESGYEGDAPGTQEFTVRMTFGEFIPALTFFVSAGGPAGKSGAAQIDASVRFVGYSDARDAEGNPVGFSLCTNFPMGTTTTTSSITTTSSSVSTTTTTASSTTTTLPGGTRDPYRVYDATGPDGPQVTLADRFRTETADLGTVRFFLPPVALDAVPASGQTSPQTCYAHAGAPFTGTADVVHQLGTQTLTLGDPVALCAPGDPIVLPVDHYACYAATGEPLDQSHMLDDAFQIQTVQVLEPFLFCVPARVDDGALVDPFTTFTCYATDPAGMAVGPVEITNAFHMATLDVAGPVGLCVASLAITNPAP
jgi:hypothetical protein